jgi:uncharacterized OB-fold protein
MTTSPEAKSISVDSGRLRLDDDAGTTGTLLGMRCRECSIYLFGQATFCQACTSDKLEPVDLSRSGVLFSYTIVRVPPNGWPGPVPYVLGEVELPEGPHVLAEVVGISEPDLRIGIDVELALQEVRGGEPEQARVVYKWAPLDRPEAAAVEA